MNSEVTSLPELPEGWVWTRLGEVGDILAGYGFPKRLQGNTTGDLPFFKVADISSASLRGDIFLRCAMNYISTQVCNEIRATPLREGTVVFAKIGEAIKLNRRAILAQDSLVDNNVAGFLPSGGINNLFAFYFFLTLKLEEHSRATTVPSVRKTDLEYIYFPLPPFHEQYRIVAEIEELFTRLDAGVDALKKIKAQLKRYRQAVLRHAFEGKLTAEWRQAHKDELEPASLLLERIKLERQKNTKGKYKELPLLDISDLPELPEGWVWSNFEELKKAEKNAIKAGPFGSSLKKESYVPHGYKIYGQEQVIRQNPSYGNYYIGEEKYVELRSCAVKPGDILISLVGTIGRVLILPEHSEAGIINPRLIKLSLEERLVDNKYIKAYIESSAVRDFFTLASHGETMEILNLGILRTLPIPVPYPTEQHCIVEEIERRFSVAEEIEKMVDYSLKQAERLRQSILKKTFEGKLVSQDPNDEPAEKLLERIKAERAKQLAVTKARSKGKKKEYTKQTRLI